MFKEKDGESTSPAYLHTKSITQLAGCYGLIRTTKYGSNDTLPNFKGKES
jgi:hypothetical protein